MIRKIQKRNLFQKNSGSGNKCSNPLHSKWGNNDKKLKMASKLSTAVITIFRHLGYERSSGCMFCETCVSKASEVAEMDKSQGSTTINVRTGSDFIYRCSEQQYFNCKGSKVL